MALTPSQYHALLILKANKEDFLKEKKIRKLYGRSSSLNFELKALTKLGLARREREGRAYEYQYSPKLFIYTEIWYRYSKLIVHKDKTAERKPVCLFTYWIQKLLRKEKIIDKNGVLEAEKYPNTDKVRSTDK